MTGAARQRSSDYGMLRQLRGKRQREEPHCCAISDLLNFLPQLAAFVTLEAFAHLSFCIILDGLMRLELRFAALAMAECDGCKFHYLENSFRHIIQLYRSNIPSASGSILVSPIASLLSLMADFRVSA
jgi:hypothetical protein